MKLIKVSILVLFLFILASVGQSVEAKKKAPKKKAPKKKPVKASCNGPSFGVITYNGGELLVSTKPGKGGLIADLVLSATVGSKKQKTSTKSKSSSTKVIKVAGVGPGQKVSLTLADTECPKKSVKKDYTTAPKPKSPPPATKITGTLPTAYASYKIVAFEKASSLLPKVTRSGAAFSVETGGRGLYALMLEKPEGGIFGPVICSPNGSQALMTVIGKATLGMLTVNAAGYATVGPTIRADVCVGSSQGGSVADAVNGIPIGVGNKGLVKTSSSSRRRMLLAEESKGGDDSDGDGFPNAADMDQNGNKLLDNVDETSPDPSFFAFSNLKVSQDKVVNAYLSSTKSDTSAVYKESLSLAIQLRPARIGKTLKDIRLGGASSGLVWLTDAGDGEVQTLAGPMKAWPKEFDYDITYGGKMEKAATGDMQFRPRVSSVDDVNGGDMLYQNMEYTDGTVETFAAPIMAVFKFQPVIYSYKVGAGEEVVLTYPLAESWRLPIPYDSDGLVTFKMYRPQRGAITVAEMVGGNKYVDLGNLRWYAEMPNKNARCFDSKYFSNLGGGLQNKVSGPNNFIVDTTSDAPVNMTTKPKVEFTLDIKECYKDGGNAWPTTAPGSPMEVQLDVGVSSPKGDNSMMLLRFNIEDS